MNIRELFKTEIGRLRIMAFFEGVSLLLIIFVTMPLKYLADMPEPNMYIGMSHGILFLLYILAVIRVKIEYDWSFKTMLWAFLASVVPFGTFIADKRIFVPTEKAAH